ncbi:hypothetical protein, partial [Paraburkholderia hospita]
KPVQSVRFLAQCKKPTKPKYDRQYKSAIDAEPRLRSYVIHACVFVPRIFDLDESSEAIKMK